MEMVVGLLAILKAGGAYVPMDPDIPKTVLEFMLRDTQASVLLIQKRISQIPPDYPGHMVCLDGDRERRLLAKVKRIFLVMRRLTASLM